MACHNTRTTRFSHRTRTGLASAAVSVLALAALAAVPTTAHGAGDAVGLGTAAQYSVAGGQAVTNTGPSVLAAGVALSPGTEVTGFPPGIVTGSIDVANGAAAQVKADLVTAYDDAAGRSADEVIAGDLGGLTLTSGTYASDSSLGLTGTLTLDAEDVAGAVFIFQVGSSLTAASSSSVSLINGADACNVFWQIGSSATLGTGSDFAGTVMALTSITATTGTTVSGRLLARNGAVTLADTVVDPRCRTDEGDGGGTSPSASTTDTTVTETPATETTATGTTGTGTGTGTTEAPTVGTTVTEATATTGTSVTETTGFTTLTESTGASSTPETTAPDTETTTATTGTGTGTAEFTAPGTTTPTTTTTANMTITTYESTPPTTTATAEPHPPRGNLSPPLAYTGTGSATIPALLLSLAFLVTGAVTMLLAHVRRNTDRRSKS